MPKFLKHVFWPNRSSICDPKTPLIKKGTPQLCSDLKLHSIPVTNLITHWLKTEKGEFYKSHMMEYCNKLHRGLHLAHRPLSEWGRGNVILSKMLVKFCPSWSCKSHKTMNIKFAFQKKILMSKAVWRPPANFAPDSFYHFFDLWWNEYSSVNQRYNSWGKWKGHMVIYHHN
jgi:hypothetical protein